MFQDPATALSSELIETREIVWLLLTLVMFLAWWAYFARRHSTDLSISERLLAAFVGMISQIVLTTLLLGHFKWLYWWPMGILNFIILVVLVSVALFTKGGHSIKEEITGFYYAVWDLLRSSSAVWVFAAPALLVSAWSIYIGQLLPPLGYDSYGYHLVWAANAHQNGSIGYENLRDPIIGAYPWNTDILFLWWILGARTGRWAEIAQAPFAFAAAIACYLLARRAGARKADAVIAGLLVFSIPTVFIHMWVSYNDLAVMGSGLAAMAFLARKRWNATSLILAGCSAGFMFGSKGSSAYILAALILYFLYRIFPLGDHVFRDGHGNRIKAGLRSIFLFSLGAVLLGSYFYIRNWITMGNPIGPYEVKIGSWILFNGDMDPKYNFGRAQFHGPLYDALHSKGGWWVVLDGFFDPNSLFVHDSRIGGWGPVWTILMLPAIPVAFIWALLRRRWALASIIFACIVPYILFKWDHTNTRFHLVLVGAGTTSLVFLISMLRLTKLRRPIIAVASALMLYSIFIGSVSWINPELIAQSRQAPYRERDRFAIARSWNDDRFVDALISVESPGSTVAYTQSLPNHKTALLWNSTYTNRAVQVLWLGNGDNWLTELKSSGASAVYIGPDSEPLAYARSRPDIFVPIYDGTLGGIYNILD